jgi:formylglycine-generating enzyme required for sulfatase activity
MADCAAAAGELIWIPGGVFRMGSDAHYPEEAPARPVRVDGFWMQATPVTNRQFAAFVQATGWITVAETPPDPAAYPGADPAALVPGSLVFTPTPGPVDLARPEQWWRFVPGACWRAPLGPGSDLSGLDDHPVTQVALADVEAYARWAGLDLPTEAEWERAARGGHEGLAYAWGEDLAPAGRIMAKTWQGDFPYRNLAGPGLERTAPVGAHPANGYGLHDMIGNVWEWTRDWWSTAKGVVAAKPCCAPQNPRGGPKTGSFDAADPLRIPRRVLKGGSHLCAPSYCRRYRPAARHPEAIDTSTSHIGFRCVARRPGPAL